MNDFFANVFETVIPYVPQFMNAVYDNQDYNYIGLTLLIFPLIFMLLFYKVWDPIPKRIMWVVITFIVTVLSVFGLTYYWAITGGMEEYLINEVNLNGISAGSFVWSISFYAAVFSLIPGIVFMFLAKKFLSINNSNNPF